MKRTMPKPLERFSTFSLFFGTTIVTLFLLPIGASSLKQIVKGSFCIGTTDTRGCDNELTNLHCYEGKCQCPEALTMPNANLQRNLNTWWYEPLNKCFAVIGSMCDLHRSKKRVECLPGVKCIPDPKNPDAGTCTGSKFRALLSLPFFLFFSCLLLN